MPSGRLSSRSAKLLPSKEFVVGKQFPLLLLLLLVMMLQLLFGVEIADCRNDPDDGAVTALAGRSPREALLPTLEGCVGDLLGERERPLLSLELERILDDEEPRRLPLELRELERDRDWDRDPCLLWHRCCGGCDWGCSGGCCCCGGEVTVELTAEPRRTGSPPRTADGEPLSLSSGYGSPAGLKP